MKLRTILFAGAASLAASGANASCDYDNQTQVTIMTAAFQAWKAATDAMAECGNFSASLDQEFRTKQPQAFAADPSLYTMGGVSNGTITPLLNQGTIRPLDDLVEKYGQDLKPNQLIRVDGRIMAVAMSVNTQQFTYRKDIFDKLGLEPPKSYTELYKVAQKLEENSDIRYPMGATTKSGWNLGLHFVNMFASSGKPFVNDDSTPNINNETGVETLEAIRKVTDYLDPEYLVTGPTEVQQQFQQGRIAMANYWATRAGALDNEAESQVVGKVATAMAPTAPFGDRPAAMLWWDGFVIAKNISDKKAEAAFRVAMEGLDSEMVKANNDATIWLIDGYEPGPLARGAIATANHDPAPLSYPSSTEMGLMHTALGNHLAGYFTGEATAEETLSEVEAAYTDAAREAGVIQ